MDGPVFYAKCDDATTLPVLHQEVQGEVLHEIAGVVPQGLQRQPTFSTALRVLHRHAGDAVHVNRLKTACNRGRGEPGRVPGGKRVADGNSHRVELALPCDSAKGALLLAVRTKHEKGEHTLVHAREHGTVLTWPLFSHPKRRSGLSGATRSTIASESDDRAGALGPLGCPIWELLTTHGHLT